mmetsp:Transcript_28899/g.85403  ORF Transcript_28899/g.85403 Transcript_28899/m.85403 type:complete len:248 (+) Transcript_28899:1101-1844(+)
MSPPPRSRSQIRRASPFPRLSHRHPGDGPRRPRKQRRRRRGSVGVHLFIHGHFGRRLRRRGRVGRLRRRRQFVVRGNGTDVRVQLRRREVSPTGSGSAGDQSIRTVRVSPQFQHGREDPGDQRPPGGLHRGGRLRGGVRPRRGYSPLDHAGRSRDGSAQRHRNRTRVGPERRGGYAGGIGPLLRDIDLRRPRLSVRSRCGPMETAGSAVERHGELSRFRVGFRPPALPEFVRRRTVDLRSRIRRRAI